jgi:hypothetical protein
MNKLLALLSLLPVWCAGQETTPRAEFLRALGGSLNGYTTNPYLAEMGSMIAEYWVLILLAAVVAVSIGLLVHAFKKAAEEDKTPPASGKVHYATRR